MINFRLATNADLPQLKKMFLDIIKDMKKNNMDLWDDVYPLCLLEEDIIQQRLYLLCEHQDILSAFVLMSSDPGQNQVEWEDPTAKALYLCRLAVNVHYQNQGIGHLTLQKALDLTKAMGFSYLRLFVLETNFPAIRLYQKFGFHQAKGLYHEIIDETLTLTEYGFEIHTNH